MNYDPLAASRAFDIHGQSLEEGTMMALARQARYSAKLDT